MSYYEDKTVLVVNKPGRIGRTPRTQGIMSGTLVNALAYYFRDEPPDYDVSDPRLGLVRHRIDKDTSGLLVISQDLPEAKTNLGLQFFNKTTQRK